MTERSEIPPRFAALTRWAGLGAVVYVVLFVVGLLVASSGQPDSGSAPARLIVYYGDSSHRDKVSIGWLLITIGIFFFVWFVAALRHTVRRLAGSGLLAAVTTIGGAAYAASTLAAFSLEAAVKTMSDDTYQHRVYPELIHMANDAAYVMHSAGGAAIGAMMVAASLAALAASTFPKWLAWLGVVAGVFAVFSIIFIPWIVIGVWLLIAGALVFRAERLVARP